MSGRSNPTGVIDVVQMVLDEGHSLELRSRDIALLVLIRHQIEARSDLSFSVEEGELRALAGKVDNLHVRDPAGAEKRLTESLTRLIRADCLARADLNRLKAGEDTEYQLTSLGENIAAWHVEHAKFSGEPMAAILRAFNSQLAAIAEQAESLDDTDIWRREVLVQMQVVLKDMLVNVQRHQRELDRQHEALRDFIPTLLTESSEASIELCESQLNQVIRTIDDLQEVTLVASSKAYTLLERIQTMGEEKRIPGVDQVCQDIGRRMQSVVGWTAQRGADWVEHHGVVHDFLRSVIRVDRQRRLTEALKRAIATPPSWTLDIADAPRLMRMREDVRSGSRQRVSPRRPRRDYARETEFMLENDLPQRLEAKLEEVLANGEARWTDLALWALEAGAEPALVINALPALMDRMMERGHLDEAARDWQPVPGVLRMQELKVIGHDVP